jgi:ABC-type amino acid transport substrate-binding protein
MEAELHPISDHAEGLLAVETGMVDAYFGDQSILFALLESSEMKDQLVVAGNTLTVEVHGLALPLGDHRMAEIFQAVFPNAEPGETIRYIHTFAPVIP